MNAVNRLRRDHRMLRSKFDVIDAALRMGPETWEVLREVCYTLSRQLQNHMKREEDLVMACRTTMEPHALAELAVEHHDEPEHLRTINRLFVEEYGHSLERIRPALTEVTQALRRHMAQEEQEVFPILERELATRKPAAPPPQETAAASRLHECMTVNGVLRRYPMTKTIFERLFVNIPYEGCDCLDEVAWRHGMESRQLFDQLEQLIPAGRTPAASAPAPEQAVCACR